jgi:hypothetical protein
MPDHPGLYPTTPNTVGRGGVAPPATTPPPSSQPLIDYGTEDAWRTGTGHAAQNFDPNNPYAQFDESSVYDPVIANLDMQEARVRSGQAGWSLERIQAQRNARLASPEYRRSVEQARLKRSSDFDEWLGKRYGQINVDPEAQKAREDQIYNAFNANVTEAERNAIRSTDAALSGRQSYVAAAMGRRGMSRSGYATGLQGEAVQNAEDQRDKIWKAAAAEREKAHESALEQAMAQERSDVALERQGIVGEAQLHGQGDALTSHLSDQAQQEYLTQIQIAAAERMARERSEGDLLGNLIKMGGTIGGTAIGSYFGGPMGGAAGSQVGGLTADQINQLRNPPRQDIENTPGWQQY